MSHERESFPILENIEDEKGHVLHLAHEGDRLLNDALDTDKNGLMAFTFKDKDDRLVMPKLNAEGAQLVTFDIGTTLRTRGKLSAGIQATVDGGGEINNHAMICEMNLTADRIYTNLSAIVSCFRDTEARIVLIDDFGGGGESTTELGDMLTGPGQFTTKFGLDVDEFDTIGFTGVIKLRVIAANINRASRISASLSVNEKAVNTSPNP